MVQDHELSRLQGQRCVGSPFIIAELDFVSIAVERFNDRSDLTANQSPIKEIAGQGNDIKQVWLVRHHNVLRQAT